MMCCPGESEDPLSDPACRRVEVLPHKAPDVVLALNIALELARHA